MQNHFDYIIIFTTCSTADEANNIVRRLVEDRLIACANITKNVSSTFWWQGELCTEQEVLIIIKSQTRHLNQITKRIKSLHSYEVPEIIAIPIIGGNKAYLDWVKKETEETNLES